MHIWAVSLRHHDLIESNILNILANLDYSVASERHFLHLRTRSRSPSLLSRTVMVRHSLMANFLIDVMMMTLSVYVCVCVCAQPCILDYCYYHHHRFDRAVCVVLQFTFVFRLLTQTHSSQGKSNLNDMFFAVNLLILCVKQMRSTNIVQQKLQVPNTKKKSHSKVLRFMAVFVFVPSLD